MGSLLLVQACALGSSKVCPSSSPYCSLDAVIEGFTKLFVPHAHKRFQCPLTELKLGLFCCSVVLRLAKHSLLIGLKIGTKIDYTTIIRHVRARVLSCLARLSCERKQNTHTSTDQTD